MSRAASSGGASPLRTLFVGGKAASVPATGYFHVVDSEATAPRGVKYSIYLLPEGPARLPDFSGLKAAAPGTAHELTTHGLTLPRDSSVAVAFDGFLNLTAGLTYRFAPASYDGSKLYVDGKQMVDNEGDHGVLTAMGSVDLAPGKHAIRVEWFNGGGAWLGSYSRQLIDPNLLTPQ